MKTLFTKNLGLKIISVLAAFILWLVVVNVDDPVISKTYTSVPVEILNGDVLSEQEKCYEVLADSATINVVVTAHRSVLDGMSRDYIKATADLKQLTSLDTVPIEVRSTRFSDRIDSVTTRNSSVKLKIENLIKKEVSVAIGYEGTPAEGYILSGVENPLTSVVVSGPESVVSQISKVMASADISGVSHDLVVTEPLRAYNSENEPVEDDRITLSRTVTEIKYVIYATKTIPISSGYSGIPAAGFGTTGTVITEPSSVVIAGKGENYDDMDVVYISPDKVSVEGASSDVTAEVNVSDYLPTGVIFADPEFDPNVEVTIGIDQNQRKIIDVPLSNITVENVPEGYMVNIVDIGATFPVEIQGIGDAYDRYSGDLAIGRINALSLVPRNAQPPEHEGAPIAVGESDGVVEFDFPAGVSLTNQVTLMVVVDHSGTHKGDESAVVVLDE
jgi:YbbR domain-containing protein